MTIAFDISGLYASREYLQNSLISNGTGITEDRFQLSQNGPGVFVFDFSSS
jgi:hypothetical protein